MRWQKGFLLRAIMKKERPFASLKALESHLQTLDMKRLYRDLATYALFRLKKKDRDGACEIVSQAFDKLFSQDRKWYLDQTFEKTIFGIVKSLSNNENKKQIKKWDSEVSQIDADVIIDNSRTHDQEFEHRDLVEMALKSLKIITPAPTEIEIKIFECWLEGFEGNKDIAELLELETKDIENGVRRLKRKLTQVQNNFLNMGYEKK